jgi:hypothetical protein
LKKAHKKKKSKCKRIQKKEKLVPIETKNAVIAPKIFKNQIFTDVYDGKGNHDRIIEINENTKEQISSSDLIVEGNLIVAPDIEDSPGRGKNSGNVRPPENSYLEDTKVPNDFHLDIMKKLNDLANYQKKH